MLSSFHLRGKCKAWRLECAYLASSPSLSAVWSGHWCLVEEFFCCADRVKKYVEAGGDRQLQYRPARGLSLTCIRMSVVVAMKLGVMVVGDAPNVPDAVTDLARIRYLIEGGSLIEQAGSLAEELNGRRAWTRLKMVKHWEQAEAVGGHSAA